MSAGIQKTVMAVFIGCLLLMLSAYWGGYSHSIDWKVTTSAVFEEFTAWSLDAPLVTHEITAERALLSESYEGDKIQILPAYNYAMLTLVWIGLCLVLSASTYASRYLFIGVVALFSLLLNRLNLAEIGLFGIYSKLVLLIPFVSLVGIMIVFHEFKKQVSFVLRFLCLVACTAGILLGVNDAISFSNHLIAHSLFSFGIVAIIFLFIIAEEVLFAILFLVTQGKGGRSNHLHFLALSLIYLGNLTLYYLNKSRLFENQLFAFDPIILLAISACIGLWSLRHKARPVAGYIPAPMFYLAVLGLGVVTFASIAHGMLSGNDAVYEAIHYFILYFHLGIGTLFFFYIIANFIDPLIKGFEVHKIVYKERNFPYATARLAGLVAVLAFYFLSGQEAYNLLRSGYYNYLAINAQKEENTLLSKEYSLQASYLGYNTHMPNYTLGHESRDRGDTYAAKTYFLSATQRFPSPYAMINYGNLEIDINPNKVQALYEEYLRNKPNGEVTNNLGLIHLGRNNPDQALEYFESAEATDTWNQAPKVNKWLVVGKQKTYDTLRYAREAGQDFEWGNFGVKANILTNLYPQSTYPFILDSLSKAPLVHRQAYLLNALNANLVSDTLESIVRREISDQQINVFSSRLQLSLALWLYQRGDVNHAFMMLDYLQANEPQYTKGKYLDALGKLSLDQGAYRLALDFFEAAVEVNFFDSRMSRLEALAALGRADEIPQALLTILQHNPELTMISNELLNRVKVIRYESKNRPLITDFTSMSDSALVHTARKNAFHEDQILAIISELDSREASGGYELLVDALEINPYSARLLQAYAFKALDWNLLAYADQSIQKLKSLVSSDQYAEVMKRYNAEKERIQATDW